MGNYNNTLDQIHFILDATSEEKFKEGLDNIFSNDADFTENVEYFRNDTISLGYKNEADRLISDCIFGRKINRLLDVIKIVEELCYNVFDNKNYYQDWDYNIIKIDDNRFSISISYIS